MKFTKYLILLGACLLIGSCPNAGIYDIKIEIGDYENQLQSWNSQNLLDYKLSLKFKDHDWLESAVVIVENGIPENSDPPSWLAKGKKSIINDFFSFIKEEEKRLRDAHNGYNICELYVQYNTEYHYPRYIFSEYKQSAFERNIFTMGY